jgi:ribonuclease P/MRP protein subunit POP5
MKKLKTLPLSLREKRRYISFKVIPEEGETFTYSDLEAGIWNTMLDFLGEYGVSKTSFWLLKDSWDERKQIGILRCNHKSVEAVVSSLGLIDRLGDNRITFKILNISGTINNIKKKIG